jgi:hypothetical protein
MTDDKNSETKLHTPNVGDRLHVKQDDGSRPWVKVVAVSKDGFTYEIDDPEWLAGNEDYIVHKCDVAIR